MPEKGIPNCQRGEVLYPRVNVTTSWNTGFQHAEYKWQCYVGDKDNELQQWSLGNNGIIK